MKHDEHIMTLRISLLLLLAVALTACGFQLRGSNLATFKNSRIYIKSGGADELALQVRRKLEFSDVVVTKDAAEADYIIELGHESFKRSVLSVSAETGKVEEYEITYNSLLSVNGPNGQVLLKTEPITAQRDYTFAEDSALGKYDEEVKLHDELTRHAADMVLRRLQDVTR